MNESTFTVSASASSGLAVTYTSSGSCSNVGATYTMTSGTGTCSVMVDQAGNGNFSPAPELVGSVGAIPARSAASLGSSPVGTPIAAPVQLTYSFGSAATLSAVVVTGPSGDITNAGGTGSCAPGAYNALDTCVVNVAFTPSAPGLRSGAVMLFASGSALPLQTWYVNGAGLSSAAAADPGTQTTLATLSATGAQAYGAAFDGAGNLYVADHANNQIVEIAAGTHVQSVVVAAGFGLSGPSGVALDGAGNLYISDAGNSRVLMVPNELSSGLCCGLALADYSLVGSSWGSPRGMAVDGSGTLYVADAANDTVSKVPPGGAPVTVASSLTDPHGVAVDADGNVYVASNGGVFKYPAGGGSRSAIGGSYSFSGPRGIAVDASRTVYVADTGHNAVVRVAPGGNGAAMTDFTGLVTPNGVAVDASGNLYVTDPAVVLELNRTQAALAFPSTPALSTSSPQSVTVSDAGNQALSFSGIAVGTSNFAVDASTTCSTSTPLAVGAQCAVAVVFTPQTGGTLLSDTLTLTDDSFNAAATQTAALSGTGSKLTQTISCSANAPATKAYLAQFTMACTATSALAVSYGSSGGCTNSGALYTMTGGVGTTCHVTVTQLGNDVYSSATPVNQSTTATRATQAIVFSVAPPASAIANSSFTVAAQADINGTSTPSGLTVVFTTTPQVCTVVDHGDGTATYTIDSGVTTGNCYVIVNQGGNTDYYQPAPQVIQTVTAVKATKPTVSLTADNSTAGYNSSTDMVTATTNASTYAVLDASATSSVCSLGTQTQTPISGGTTVTAYVTMLTGTGVCTVTASWAQDTNFAGATAKVNIKAAKIAPTVTFTGAPGTSVYGNQFTVATTTNASTAAVIKAAGGCALGGGGTVTMTSGTTTCTLTATWPTDANYLAVTTATALTQTVTTASAPVTLAWAPSTTPFDYGEGVVAILAPYNATATASLNGNPPTSVDGKYVYTATPAVGAPITLAAATMLPPGTYTLSVTFAPKVGSNYAAPSPYIVSPTLTVNPAGTTTTINTATPAAKGHKVTVYVTVADAETPVAKVAAMKGSITVTDSASGAQCTIASLSVAGKGSCTVDPGHQEPAMSLTAVYSGDTNYNGSASTPPTTVSTN